MAGEPEQINPARENQGRVTGRVTNPNPDNGAFSDENPDLLRWRADILMDEMMLGGVDVSGADGAPKPASPVAGNPPPAVENGYGAKNGNGVYPVTGNGHAEGYHPNSATPPAPGASTRNGHEGTPPASASPAWASQENGWSSPGNGKEDHPNGSYPNGSYPNGNHPSSDHPSGAYPNGSYPNGAYPNGSYPNGTNGSDHTPVDERNGAGMNGLSANGAAPADAPNYANPAADWPASQSANGQFGAMPPPAMPDSEPDAGGYVSAMAVMPGGKKRSTLLPRMSSFDVEASIREINELHAEIAATAMPGSDGAERARHLLDKAYTILQADPMRSAEVEYYMQQVRTIVQRMRQLRRWSDLYRDRLRVYLWAWIMLSALMLVGAFVFPLQLQSFVAGVFGVDPDSAMVLNAAAFWGACFAGALGGALGTLINMARHTQREQGFFDRKYGLRGLILPIIGALGGMLIYLLFAVLYLVAGIEVSASLIATLIPAAAAFILGYSQEALFGTRA